MVVMVPQAKQATVGTEARAAAVDTVATVATAQATHTDPADTLLHPKPRAKSTAPTALATEEDLLGQLD